LIDSGAGSHLGRAGQAPPYIDGQEPTESIRYSVRNRDLNVKQTIINDRSGRASGGLILSVVLAAAIIAVIVYSIVGPSPSEDVAPTSGGIPMSPMLGAVEATRQQVDLMNRQRSAAGQALGVTRTPYMDATNDLSWRARRDCSDIATAIQAFQRDTRQWPINAAADEDERIDYLFGNVGQIPQFGEKAKESWGDSKDNLHSYVVSNGPEKKAWYDHFKNIGGRFDGWNGPYLPRELADPWGHAYVVSVSGFSGGTKPDNNAWCLSAGPNGIVETPAPAKRPKGDDVGIVVR